MTPRVEANATFGPKIFRIKTMVWLVNAAVFAAWVGKICSGRLLPVQTNP